jgi:hypothetical protein
MSAPDDDLNGMVRGALQPDGQYHLVTGRDRLRSVCGIRLTRHKYCLWDLHAYGSDPRHCQECAAILDRRARFPDSPNEELKPVLERIAKLFALTESPNENEAAAALAKANQLLEKYNLTRGVVEDSGQQKAEKGITDSLGANVQPYKYILARATARLHDVELYIHRSLRDANGWRLAYDKHAVFVGLPANVATALATYSYLTATAEAFWRSMRREHSGGSARNYKQGFAVRIAQRVTEHKRSAWEHSGAAELIRIGTEVAREAMRVEHLFLGGSYSAGRGVGDSEAYRRGYQDGARVDIHGARTNRMLDEG